jgi:glycosyltransferase involved in cell wall biosynthesis
MQSDRKEGLSDGDAASREVLQGLYRSATGCGDPEYVPLERPVDLSRIDVRAIAFYLPQFHPIPENDQWWGRGFTEWTNVSKAVPQFVGHYQPRLPGELGFYDLRVPEVMSRQVELARHYGLKGFCFHYYWFGGRRLLERPLQQFIDAGIDFPFCVCWANENWTRRWDGFDHDVLIGQNHSPEDDIAFINSLEPMLRDSRYIRVDGRPLIVLYRPSLLPEAAATLDRWRSHCRQVGIGELFLAMVQFDVDDPRVYGFDAAIEFPPHKLARDLQPINNRLQITNPDYRGHVLDYGDIVERARRTSAPRYDMIRGVFPSWDNEARKPGAGYTFVNATPQAYQEWLELAIEYARDNPVAGERLVFINAWNEWAEAAYLEPDRKYGYAYLEKTREALLKSPHLRKIAIVSHDAHPHGAQYLGLYMAKMYREAFGFEVHVILLQEGRLRDEFARWAIVHDLFGVDPFGPDAVRLAHKLFSIGVRHAIVNTTVTGLFARTLKDAGLHIVGLVHELPGIIRSFDLFAHAQALAEDADYLVFASEHVKQGFEKCIKTPLSKAVIRPQGLYKLNRFAFPGGREQARRELRRKLGVPDAAKIVICVGYADHRKGIDLFVEIGKRLMETRGDLHFLWVGHFDQALQPAILESVAGLEHRFHFPGIDPDTDVYYAGADVYALTSREDPFPSVVMEALQVEVPVVGFDGAGGFVDLLTRGVGTVVPAQDVSAFATAVAALLDDPLRARAMGELGRHVIEDEYDFRKYLFDLVELLGRPLPKISVIVPNYNYAHLLPERMKSILRQTIPFYELIVLDDASTDESIEAVEKLATENNVELRLIRNDVNSGCVSRQWNKGVELATGELIWIAEADDLSEPGFLQALADAMLDKSVVMAYCQSRQIDEHGHILANNYFEYTNDVCTRHWLQAHRAKGIEEIRNYLAVKNTIPNVSAVLFRREALVSALRRDLETMATFKIAGDWVAYLGVLEQGDIAYVPEPLNLHRRHSSSVTLGSDTRPHMLEVLRVQHMISQRYLPEHAVREKMAAYAEHLGQYFGLSSIETEQLWSEHRFSPDSQSTSSQPRE